MKVALAGYGSRGDVEPLAAMGRELLRRGHEVCMAVPPNMFGFVESAGLTAVAFGSAPPQPGDEDFAPITRSRIQPIWWPKSWGMSPGPGRSGAPR